MFLFQKSHPRGQILYTQSIKRKDLLAKLMQYIMVSSGLFDILNCPVVEYLDRLQVKVNTLQELQSQTGEELDALLPSVLDRAFKGEL